jgi:hypothetical protein
MKHISKPLTSFLETCFDRTLEGRHNKPAKNIRWVDMTKAEQTILLELVNMKTRANKRRK